MKRCARFVAALAVAGVWMWAAGCGPDSSSGNNNWVPPDGYVFPDARPRPDADGCENHCSTGEKQCVTGGYQECGNYDADACLEWGPVKPCGNNEKCENGDCVPTTCTDDCIQGSVRCDPDPGVEGTQTCEQGGDGCYHWGSTVNCQGNDTCSGGQCSGTCSDECTQGSRQCASDAGGEGVQVCGDYDADACLEWGPITYCNANETCSNGQCDTGCANECTTGELRCDGSDGFQECGDFDSDPCLEWSQKQLCPQGETCSNGQCDINCTDECDPLGYRECTTSGDGWRECVDTDPDPCFEWSLPTSCNPGDVCQSGQCVAPCSCDYYTGICEAESPGSTQPCSCDTDCGGGGQPCTSDGHCDTWCPPGVDPDCGGCYCDWNEYCEAESNPSTTTCPCDLDCELNEMACDGDAHCDSWCTTGVDPDCGEDPCRGWWMSVGWRYADQAWLYDAYTDPDPVEGAPWVLLSPGFSEGTAEIFVEFAAEHSNCVDSMDVEVYGYDDSTFGDGAEVYLYNWNTFDWDLLWVTVGGLEQIYINSTFNTADYVYCGSLKCYVNAKATGSAWDNTHIYWMEIWVWMDQP